MKIFSISDIHISPKKENNYNLFLKFLNRCLIEKDLTHLILIGDIFEYMVGNYTEYINHYKNIFTLMDQILERKIEIIFIEGNHDFFLSELLEDYFNKRIIYCKNYYSVTVKYKKLLYVHGDNFDYTDWKYTIFKSMIRSNCFKLSVNNFLNFKQVSWLGNKLSKNSRKIITDKEYLLFIKEKYKKLIIEFNIDKYFDVIIFGHTHIVEQYEDDNIKIYNNGYVPDSKNFISYSDNIVQHEKI